jgi:hypothetical protein
MAKAAEIDLPGKGSLWMIPILKAVTHVPDRGAGKSSGGSGA